MRAALLCGAAACVTASPVRLHDPRRVVSRATAALPEQNCPVGPRLVPLPAPLPAALQAAVDGVKAMAEALVSPAMPGFGLVLTYGDQVLLRTSAGVANATSGLAWAPSTPSRIASVSKVLPALLLHQLADLGAVSLDGVVADDCPDFAVTNPWDGGMSSGGDFPGPTGAGITWRQLASQLSGLQREAPYGSTNTSAALRLVAGSLLVAPPGGRPSYSNLAFAVLGHLLAECVVPAHPGLGLPADLPSLASALVTKPLGTQWLQFVMGSDPGPALDAAMAAGTDANGAPIPQADFDLGWWYPAGAGVASADDLSLLGRALLAAAAPSSPAPGASVGSRLGLTPDTARAMLTPLFREPDGSYLQGAPWEMRPRGLNASAYPPQTVTDLAGGAPFLVLNKGGNLPGYTALLAVVPTLNVTLAAVFNGGVDEFGFSDAVADAVLPPLAATLAAADPAPRGEVGPRPPAFYAGTFLSGASDGAVVVQVLPGAPPAPPSLLYALQQGGTYSFFLEWVGTVALPAQAAALAGAHGLPPSEALNITSVDFFRAYLPPPAQLPPGALPCTEDVTLALRGQTIVFYLSPSGAPGGALVPAATAMPGFVPGVVYLASLARAAAG